MAKLSGFLVSVIVLTVFLSSLGWAHQPRLVMGKDAPMGDPVEVEEPQISQAYYGELNGTPQYYRITSDEPFLLYAGLLLPDIVGQQPYSVSAEVLDSSGKRILFLDGDAHDWEPFFEEFGGDWYLNGPEAEKELQPGTYYIKVFNDDNSGRYSLAVGKEEHFSFFDMIEAYVAIVLLKQLFFGKSVFVLFFHLAGIGIALGSVAGMAFAKGYKSKNLMWGGIALTILSFIPILVENPLNLLGLLKTLILIILILLALLTKKFEKNRNALLASIMGWLAVLLITVAAM